MAYPTIPGYPIYQQAYTPQPYQDRLAQLQNQYQQAIPQQMQVTQQPINQGILWVQGEAGAKSYLVAPSTTVLLMDSEAQRFYLKSTDGAGMPNLRTFEYTEILTNAPQASQTNPDNLDDKYVTREEYNSLQARYAEILDKINNFPTALSVDDSAKRSPTRGNAGRNKGGNTDVESTV